MSIILPRPLFDDRPSGLADLDQRSRNIFRRLVDTYLETGEPVGSRTISRNFPTSLSSASMRKVTMELNETGLIYLPTPMQGAGIHDG
jgi:heat-inducible transcriptional repressor